MVGPAAKRDAVAHLRSQFEMSERRACAVIAADRTTIRYRSIRPDDSDLRDRLRGLAQQRRRFGYRRLFTLDAKQVDYRWRKARDLAGAAGLHFHDLRHEGLSRMAEKGLTIGELAEQSGHRTAQVLLRYVNAKVSEVSEVSRKLG